MLWTDAIVAAAKGRFIRSESSQLGFNEICLEHSNGYRTYYFHMASWSQKLMEATGDGTAIEAGDDLGIAGGTGPLIDADDTVVRNPDGTIAPDPKVFGVHLHFSVKRLDRSDPNSPKWVIVDPYGTKAKDGAQCQPRLWLDSEETF